MIKSMTINPEENVAIVLFQCMMSVGMGTIELSMERNLGRLRAASVATMQGDNTNISKELHFNTGIEVVSPEEPPRLYQVQRNRSQALRKARQ